MIDFHSHILPSIDDGAKTLEESITILKEAEKAGVTNIIVTPHFILGSQYEANTKTRKEKLEQLNKEIAKQKLNMKLYLGNEVYVENNMLNLLKQKKVSTIHDSQYILFELPLNNTYHGLEDLIFNLKLHGYQPVIAHPERYQFLKENPKQIETLLEQGALFQCNLGSFFGFYGHGAEDLAWLFLKHHMVHFIGSDVHNLARSSYHLLEDFKKKALRYISEEELDNILDMNALKVLKKEEMIPMDFTPIKKSLFNSWK